MTPAGRGDPGNPANSGSPANSGNPANPANPGNPAHPTDSADPGTAGASARAEYQRRHRARQARIDKSWGPLAGVVKAVSSDPQSTTAWRDGALGEERVATDLARRAGDRVLFLYDRRVPGTRGNIDIIAVAPSGVWVIDVKSSSGRVEHRDVGGLFKRDLRVYVGGRDRSSSVSGMGWQLSAVGKALGECGLALPGGAAPEVHADLCFTGASWGLLAKPFLHDGILVTWSMRLADSLCRPGPLALEEIRAVHEELSRLLPSKGTG